MREFLEDIADSSAMIKFAILLGSVGLGLMAYWFLFYSSLSGELDDVSEKIGGLKFEISKRENIARHLPEYETRVEELDVELKKALAQLPDKKEIPRLLTKISNKAKSAGLDINLFRPSVQTKRDFYAEVPVELKVYGGYHQLAVFFDEVGHLDRVVNIRQFSIEDPVYNEDSVALTGTVVAVSFRFLEESERVSDRDKGSTGRRRRRRRR